jgi:hypothetical protein
MGRFKPGESAKIIPFSKVNIPAGIAGIQAIGGCPRVEKQLRPPPFWEAVDQDKELQKKL